jgi:hypothetical protein
LPPSFPLRLAREKKTLIFIHRKRQTIAPSFGFANKWQPLVSIVEAWKSSVLAFPAKALEEVVEKFQEGYPEWGTVLLEVL